MSVTIDNEITYDTFIQKNLCRLCWVPVEEEMNWVKSENYVSEMFDKVIECIGINLYENIVPNRICNQCEIKLDTYLDYKTSCIKANDKLRELIEIHQTKVFSCSPTFADVVKPEAFVKTEIDIDFEEPYPIDIDDVTTEEKKSEGKTPSLRGPNQKQDDKPGVRTSYYKNKKTPTYCNICHTDYHCKELFRLHNSEAHGIEDDGSVFKCFGCDRRFTTRKARVSHERHFCKGLKNGYKCKICNRYQATRGMYENHVKNHKTNKIDTIPDTSVFKCRQCDKSYHSKPELVTHKLLEHAIEKRDFICEQCGQIFHRQDYLRKHRMIHGNIKDYTCSECGYTTRQKSSLIVHIRKHTGERPYSCDLCDQKCVSSSNLTAHRRRHLGVKDFECTICLKRFGYKASLEDHMVSVHSHGDALQKKYCCEVCAAIFPRPRGLRRHMRAKHKIVEKTDSEDKVDSGV